MKEPRYIIIRCYAPELNREHDVIETGLTLEEAQAHCSDPETRIDGEWFDAYYEE